MIDMANHYQKKQLIVPPTKLNVGIVGAGLMGYWHAVNTQRIGGNIVAVLDLDRNKASSLTKYFAGAKAFSDIEQMFKKSQPDILHICTPLSSHQHLAELAINRGIHLLIEKPMMVDAISTEKLYQHATKQQVSICPVHQFLFQRGVLKAKQNISRLGGLIHIESTISSAGTTGYLNSSLDKIVEEILPHPLSLMERFLPTGLPKEQWRKMQPKEGEFRAWGQTHSGITLSLFISMNARPTVCQITLIGTKGTIHIDLFHGYSFYEPGNVSKAQKIFLPFDISIRRFGVAAYNLSKRFIYREIAYPGLYQLIELFYKSLKAQNPLPILPEEVLAVAETRDILMK